MDDKQLMDAISSPEGYDRQFENYVSPEWLAEYKGTGMEAIRREEFDSFLHFIAGKRLKELKTKKDTRHPIERMIDEACGITMGNRDETPDK
jgi:hypothetical protein